MCLLTHLPLETFFFNWCVIESILTIYSFKRDLKMYVDTDIDR